MAKERKIVHPKKRLGFFLMLITCFVCCVFSSFAIGTIDVTADVSVTLRYTGKHGSVTNAKFLIYHVADVTENGSYNVTDAFKSAPIAFEGLTKEGWQQLATTLKGYVWDKKIAECDSGKTDQTGKLTFPGEGKTMKPGLYLVLGDAKTIGSYTYYATPFLICLPGLDESGQQKNYHADVSPKYRWDYDDQDDSESEDNTITRKVLKVWKDEGYEGIRPEAVTIQLLRDGFLYDTVTLDKKNNWRHSWYDLTRGHDWLVVEEYVSGYTVNIIQEGITFVVTNIYDPNQPDQPTAPEKPDDMIQEEYEEWLEVQGVGEADEDMVYLAVLPQTGQLWWPVPILVCLGFVCMIIGAISRRSSYEEE